jgi:Mg2+ and Co2+ transporter CorA
VSRHPFQHWGWLTLFIGITCALIAGGIVASRRLETAIPVAE